MFDFAFTPSRGPSRNECARQARDAVEIALRGAYTAPSGRRVVITDSVARAIADTVEHRPEDVLASKARTQTQTQTRTRTSVVNGTSLESGRAFARRGLVPLVLNFASAKHPGGGFLRGARAQEESLCRASALYPCLVGRSMYDFHAKQRDPIYAAFMIHSPNVVVFMDDDGKLLEEPWLCSFLTSPAPNAGAVLPKAPERADEVTRALHSRVTRVLEVAAHYGHRHLVLGAWGCGVFANDPKVVARAFRDELDGAFAGVFEEVVFAIVDWSDERRFIRPFVELFL